MVPLSKTSHRLLPVGNRGKKGKVSVREARREKFFTTKITKNNYVRILLTSRFTGHRERERKKEKKEKTRRRGYTARMKGKNKSRSRSPRKFILR